MPCNQFYNQEPSADPQEIENVIRWVRPGGGFELEFPIFARSAVNGETRLPLYQWMTSRCESPVPFFNDPNYMFYTPMTSSDIRWNFEKTLFDQNGQPYRRYASTVEPFEIEADILMLLSGS